MTMVSNARRPFSNFTEIITRILSIFLHKETLFGTFRN